MSQGYFDDVYIIFKARQHPFILVEEAAFRWMGQRVCHEEVSYHTLLGVYLNRLTFLVLGSRPAHQRLRDKCYQS